ncbi:hypothetical protein HAX54_047273, partial [Datura stramonium]|nr:hypothetical protein [Datura stramonium]
IKAACSSWIWGTNEIPKSLQHEAWKHDGVAMTVTMNVLRKIKCVGIRLKEEGGYHS